MTYNKNPLWLTIFISLILFTTSSNLNAQNNRISQTLKTNQTLSIFSYKCGLSLKSNSSSKVIIECKKSSNGNLTRPLNRRYLRRNQSTTIKSKSCSLRVINLGAKQITLQCASLITPTPVSPTATATETPTFTQTTTPTPTETQTDTPTQTPTITPTPTQTPIPTTNISVSVNTLALSVNDTALNAALTGTPRIITITNTGSDTALSISYSISPSFPSGTTINSTCSNLSPSSTCVLTITPGQTSSATPGDTTPSPIVLTINGTNTNSVATNVHILTYGSVYQGGYLFAVDDTTPSSNSIGGKVVALSDQSISIPWDPGCPGACTNPISSNSNFDGQANSAAIVSALTTTHSANSYAAGLCTQPISGFTDWYLPATCEISYGDNGGSPCGLAANPTIQNIQSNIGDLAIISLNDSNWSSTQIPGAPSLLATYNIYGSSGLQFGDLKETGYFVRCVRAVN